MQCTETESSSRSRRLSSPSSTSESSEPVGKCEFCNRPSQYIICRACGHTFQGRTRLRCHTHPGIIHLMDFQCCPKCMATQLKECGVAAVIGSSDQHSDLSDYRRRSSGATPHSSFKQYSPTDVAMDMAQDFGHQAGNSFRN